MAKTGHQYTCGTCGSVFPKWAGQCTGCLAWNTLVEETVTASPFSAKKTAPKKRGFDFETLHDVSSIIGRHLTAIDEFDRVLGGGLVPGSVVLVGGDPGIGKSTLLLQVAASLSKSSPVAYISGEEGIDQIRHRAGRLGIQDCPVRLAAATDVGDIIKALKQDKPSLAIIDSIQTMYLDTLDAAPGSVSQVRASTHEFVRLAKDHGISIILVGHVTKEGTMAGPRVLEHMVDTVLYFEGERGHHFRLLRSVKNRFGATDEIGVFEMGGMGLIEVKNPSALFLSERQAEVSGSAVFAGIEGTRPVLVEIQALIAPSSFGTPRRSVVGWDSGRLAMILGVLEARCDHSFAGQDIFLNVAGGLKISEPAADLAVACALLSALYDDPLCPHTIFFGEIGLSGEVRRVSHIDGRLKEAFKLGFKKAVGPAGPKKTPLPAIETGDFHYQSLGHLRDLSALIEGDPKPKKPRKTFSGITPQEF